MFLPRHDRLLDLKSVRRATCSPFTPSPIPASEPGSGKGGSGTSDVSNLPKPLPSLKAVLGSLAESGSTGMLCETTEDTSMLLCTESTVEMFCRFQNTWDTSQ